MLDFLKQLHHAQQQKRGAEQREHKAGRRAYDAPEREDGEKDADKKRPHDGVHRAALYPGRSPLHEIAEWFFRGRGFSWFSWLGHGAIRAGLRTGSTRHSRVFRAKAARLAAS